MNKIKDFLSQLAEMVLETILSVGVYVTLTMFSDKFNLSETEVGLITLLFAIVFANKIDFSYRSRGRREDDDE